MILIGFSVENYKSFFNETTLSMYATVDREYRGINTFTERGSEFLKNVLIYGTNSGGKSNFVEALYFMRSCALAGFDSQAKLFRECEPFLFNSQGKDKPSKFEISFLSDGVIYEYGFSILGGMVNSEYLYKSRKRRTMVFERTSPNWQDIRISTDMDNVKSLLKNVREDILLFSWAHFANNELAGKVMDLFSCLKINTATLHSHENIYSENYDSNQAQFDLVSLADKGIQGLMRDKNGLLMAKYGVYEGDEAFASREIHLDFEKYSSAGTKHIEFLSGAINQALTEGNTILIIDDIDSHLHPSLVRYIISLFNSYKHNANNSQLICTTHGVLLLDESIRRDQVWFMDKDARGISNLYSLSDFKDVRKNSDILKRYLRGVYGAVPAFEK